MWAVRGAEALGVVAAEHAEDPVRGLSTDVRHAREHLGRGRSRDGEIVEAEVELWSFCVEKRMEDLEPRQSIGGRAFADGDDVGAFLERRTEQVGANDRVGCEDAHRTRTLGLEFGQRRAVALLVGSEDGRQGLVGQLAGKSERMTRLLEADQFLQHRIAHDASLFRRLVLAVVIESCLR